MDRNDELDPQINHPGSWNCSSPSTEYCRRQVVIDQATGDKMEIHIAYKILRPPTWRTLGESTPLVMIQGLSATKEDWGIFASNIAMDRPVLVFDNRWIGESGPRMPFNVQYSILDMAQDVIAVLDHIHWSQVNLLGISMGGMIAQQVALLQPSRFTSICLCVTHNGGHVDPPDPQFFESVLPPPTNEKNRTLVKMQIVDKILRVNLTDDYVHKNKARIEALIRANLHSRRPLRVISAQESVIVIFPTS